MNTFRIVGLLLISATLFVVEIAEKRLIYNGWSVPVHSLIGLGKSAGKVLDSSIFGGDGTQEHVVPSYKIGNEESASRESVSPSQSHMLISLDYLNVTSSIDNTLSESYTSFDGCSLFEEESKKKDKDSKEGGQSAKGKGRGQSIQEQLSSDLLALGMQAVLKRKYNEIRLSSKFSFEEMTKCLFEDDHSKKEGIISGGDRDFSKSFVECCNSYIPDVLGKGTLKFLKRTDPEKYILSFCMDLKLMLDEIGIAFRIPFKWLPSASERLSFLSKLKISGSKNLVNNKKYCHLPRKTLDIVFDVDLTLLTMVPVFEVTPGEKSIMLEMLEVPQELKAEGRDFKFNTRRASDNTIRYNIPHEVHLNPQTIGLLFSLYYRRFLDPCVGSIGILSAGFNTILKFATSMDIEPILSPSRFHLSDTILELFPDDNERSWATERPALLAFKENRITSIPIPPLHVSTADTATDDEKSQKFIRSFPDGFPELVYNGLPFLVKDMQRYRLHATLQKGSSSYDYMLMSEELNPMFLNTLRLYQTMKRYPILTHPFNNPNLFSNNRPMSLLVDDELLHFTYACSMEAWSDNILIAWTEKLGPREVKIPFSKYYLPIPLQHNNPRPIKMGEFSRNLNVMMNLDYFEGLTYQISQLKSLNASGKHSLGKDKNQNGIEELNDMEQFLSSASESELDWSGNLNIHRDNLFNINSTDSTSSITPSKLLQLVYPDGENSQNMFSCPYDISNIKIFYIALIVPCEALYLIHRKLQDINNDKKDPIYKLIKMIDMFVVTNERKEEICDKFISSLSGVLAFKNEENVLNRKVIYSSVPSLAALKSVLGLPIYRTITIWLQNSNLFEESQLLRNEVEREVLLMESRLKDTSYEPLTSPKQIQHGIIYDRSVYDIESLIILEPIRSKVIREVSKFNTIQELEESMGLIRLLTTIRNSLELGYRDVKKRINLENPTAVTSQAVISVLMYSMCFGIAVEQFSKFHLNVCNLPRPVFSRPVLRRNQQEWMKFAITNVLTELNIKLSFPITRSFERKLEASIYVSNPKSSLFNSLFQPYFSGTPYKPIKNKMESDQSSQNSDHSNIYNSIKSNRDSREVSRKNLVMLHDDLLEYLINSLSSLDYMPFFVRQCISVTTAFVRFQGPKVEPVKSGAQKPSNIELASIVCKEIQDYLQKKVPQFFKL
ncbi:putative signal peptide-containing secreted protein [Cryptosporidium canis]|nr:putative signal peptide-containing secreted protein [Cryptosporidium canis]